MMDPQLGRWHVVDAMAENNINASPYAYVQNNPINYIDLLGLDRLPADIKRSGGGAYYVGNLSSPAWSTAMYGYTGMSYEGCTVGNTSGNTFADHVENLMNSPKGGTWSPKYGYTFFSSDEVGGDAWEYGVEYNNRHDSWQYTEIKDEKILYNLQNGLAWDAGRGNAGVGLSYTLKDPPFNTKIRDDYYTPDPNHGTLMDFILLYNGMTIKEITDHILDNPFSSIEYVEDPNQPGKYIDMKHMLIAGKYGIAGSDLYEVYQMFAWPKSAWAKQDLYSNYLGVFFYQQYWYSLIYKPRNATTYIYRFLKKPNRRRYWLYK